jgi:hypothetical protein
MYEQQPPSSKPNLLQVVSSVLAAAFGVQSTANRERDFTHGSAKVYIVAGIIFTALFVFLVLTVVRFVIK